MVSTENKPNSNLIVFAGARHIPTFRGFRHTEATRLKIKAKLKSRGRKPKEFVRNQSPKWQQEKSLFLRGLSIGEVAQITGRDKKLVRTDLYRRRPSENSLPKDFFTKTYGGGNETERRRRAAKPGQPKRLVDRASLSDNEVKNIKFVQLMLAKGFIEEDMSAWEELHVIFQKRGKELPHELSDKLSLEVFLKARRKADVGDKTWLDEYSKIGMNLGLEWFDRLNEERRFIRDVIAAKRVNGNGHNNSHSVDGPTIWQAFRTLKEMGVKPES